MGQVQGLCTQLPLVENADPLIRGLIRHGCAEWLVCTKDWYKYSTSHTRISLALVHECT